MSRTIDQRIVEMRFDNGQFESGAEKTLSTLDKLKQSLNVFGSGEALKDLGSNTLSGLTISLETATKGFSALEEIAVGALRKIGEQALMAGEHLVKEMSIDNVTAGWDKYAQKTSSVQTIMAATRKEIGEGKMWANEEEQMAGVNEQLDRLNWFTDETSYNFLDMVQNIGKFTNNGVKLEDAVTSMQGISTWAAISGANVQEASRAMYNLSQAMGVGYVQLIDWKSIENANMATMEFKEMAIQAAIARGTVKDLGDGLYQAMYEGTEKGDPFTIEQFNTQLSKGKWLTKDVLTEVTGMYGTYATVLKDAQDQMGDYYDTTTTLLKDVEEYQKTGSFKNWNRVMKDTGLTAEELTEIFDKLSDEQYDLGRRAFIAAQEAKTFREAIDATKDAAGTSWMNIFEAIFGNYLEAKELWTNLSEALYSAFITPLDNIEDLLSGEGGWREFGGREKLIQSFSNTWEALGKVIGSVTEAFHEVFPPMTGERLAKLTERLQNFTQKLIISDETAEKLKSTFHVVFGVFRIGFEVINQIVDAIKPLVSLLFGLGDGFLGFAGGFEESIDSISKSLETNKTVQRFIENAINTVRNFAIRLSEAFQKVKDSKVGEILGDIWTSIQRFCSNFTSLLKDFHPFKQGGFKELTEDIQPVEGALNVFGTILQWLVDLTKDVISAFGPLGKTILGVLGNLGKGLSQAVGNGGLGNILTSIIGGGIGLEIGRMAHAAGDALWTISEPLEGLTLKLKSGALKDIAISIAILAGSLLVLASINPDRMAAALMGLTAAFANLATFSEKIFKSLGSMKGGKAGIAVGLIGVATTMLILTSVIKRRSNIEPAAILKGLIAIQLMGRIIRELGIALDSRQKANVGAALGLVVAVIAIGKLAKVVSKLAEIPATSLLKGLIATQLLGRVAKELGKMLDNRTTFGIGQAAGLFITAEALKVMAKAVERLGNLNLEQLAKGLGSIGVLLLELGIFTKMAGGYKHMISIGIGVAAISAAMVIMGNALANMGNLSWEQIGKGLLAVGGSLLIMTMALRSMPKNTAFIATGVVILAAALKIIAGVMKTFGGFDAAQLATSIVMLAASLSFISIALNTMKGTLGAAAAFAVIALALDLLVPALMALGKMKVGEVVKSLVMLAGVFAIIGVAGVLLGPIVPVLLALAGVIVLLSIATLGVGVGLTAFGIGLTMIAASGGAAIGVLIFGIKSLLELIPFIITTVGEGLISIITMIGEGATAIATTVSQLLLALLQVIHDVAPTFVETVLYVLELILTSIYNHVPTIIGLILQILVSICDTIAANVGPVVASVVNLILSVIKGIADQLPVIIQAGFDLFLGLIYGIIEAIQTNTPLVVDAIGDLIDTVIDAIEYALISFIEGLPVVGKIPGVASWIEDSKASIEEGWNSDDHGVKVGASEAHGISEGLAQNGWEPVQAAHQLGSDVAGALTDNGGDFQEVGGSWVQQLGGGLVNGNWESFSPDLKNIGTGLAGDLTSGVTEGFDLTTLEFNGLGLDVVTNLSQGIGDNSGLLSDATANLGNTGLESFSSLLPNFQTAGSDSAMAISDQFTSLGPEFGLSMEGFGNMGLEGFTDLMPSFDLAGQDTANAISGGIDLAAPNAVASANAVGTDSLAQVQNKESGFYDSGKNFSLGLANGMNDYASEAANAAASLAAQAKAAADAQLGIASPSKEMIKTGRFFDEGFAVGISQNETLVGGATTSMANSAIEAMRLALMSINDTMDDDLNLNPVIRPVVDLSDVQSSSSMLGGMLGNVSYSGVGQINPNANSNRMLDLLSAMNGMMGNGGTTNIEINVTGGPNANARDIADEVMDRMNNELRRRKVAWG